MKDHGKMYVSSLLLALLIGAGTTQGEVYRVNQRSQWQEWQFPSGTLELRADGSVIPVKFEGNLNASLDAPQYSHETKGGEVQGGVHNVGSNPATAGHIIDGNPDTWWKPDPTDPLEKWWVEIDLGRSIPVTRVRLVFPDEEGARPFQEFRVFGSDGQRIGSASQDVFSFHLIGGTTRANEQTAVRIRSEAARS